MLAMADLTTLETLARQGGPFAIAFALFIIGGLVLWKYALKPAFDSLSQMHSTAASGAASSAEAARTNLAAAQVNSTAADLNREAATVNRSTAELTGKLNDKLLERLT